jgi:uncharacterized membrane protein YeaQ/YmgE (transglycosylase-associated protein family)
MHLDGQTFLIIVVVGVIAGGLGVVVGGSDLLTYLLFGTVGAFLGDYVFAALNTPLLFVGLLGTQIFVTAIGAIVLVTIARLILRSSAGSS